MRSSTRLGELAAVLLLGLCCLTGCGSRLAADASTSSATVNTEHQARTVPSAASQTSGAIILPGYRTTNTGAGALPLAENGKALQRIILSPAASNELKATAAYLAAKLKRITGADFLIQSGDGASGIVIGTIQQFPVDVLKQPLEIRPGIGGIDVHNGAESYAIRTEKNRLLLLGGAEPGASHAVARFLDLLGYRRFYPAPEWEIVPSTPTLSFNRDETDRPSYLSRELGLYVATPAISEWRRQNRLGHSFQVVNAQWAYSTIARDNKAAFDAHPEYYALLKGKRTAGDALCLGNPAVRAMAVKYALDYFAKNPQADMCSMESPDGGAFCECPACQALGDVTARSYGLANEVARAVRDQYPGKMIGMLAYFDHTVPPHFALEPNIHVQLCRIYIQSGLTFQQMIDQWSGKTRNIGDYDYLSLYCFGQDRLRNKANAMPTANLDLLRGDLALMSRNGFFSLFSECGQNWGAHGRGNLVATRLLWNPDADVDTILNDFYEKSFGPAAPVMKRYFNRVDGDNEFFSKTLLGLAFRDVDEAARVARERPDVQARLDHIKQFLYYNHLCQQSFHAKDEAARKDLDLKNLIHQFRIRDSYLTSWWMVKTFSLAGMAKKYAEPSLVEPNWKAIAQWKADVKAKKPTTAPPVPPWMADPKACIPDPTLPNIEYIRANDIYQPYTHAETERLFQEGLAFYQPQALLPAVTCSTDWVPVNFRVAPTPVSTQVQTDGGRIYLYSFNGEPVEIEIQAIKDHDLHYTLRDHEEKLLTTGLVPKDADSSHYHALALAVPAAGMYSIECSLSMVSRVAPGRVNTVMPKGYGHAYNSGGLNGRTFFYVPKGTRQIQYFWGGAEHKVYNPSGKEVCKAAANWDYLTIPVGPGEDGMAWSFSGDWNPRHFVNVPNAIAPSPDALLVPRELALKDGLTIRDK